MINNKVIDAISKIDLTENTRPYLSEKNGVSELQITEAEKNIGFCFPVSYRYFLKNFGCGDFGGYEFYGLIKGRNDYPDSSNTLWYTEGLRNTEGLPKDLLVIEPLGDGCEACLELHQDPSLEGRIILWDMGESTDKARYALSDTYGQYFYKQIMEALEND